MHYMNYNNLETEVKKKLLEYDLISTTSKINLIPCHRIIIQGEYFSHFFIKCTYSPNSFFLKIVKENDNSLLCDRFLRDINDKNEEYFYPQIVVPPFTFQGMRYYITTYIEGQSLDTLPDTLSPSILNSIADKLLFLIDQLALITASQYSEHGNFVSDDCASILKKKLKIRLRHPLILSYSHEKLERIFNWCCKILDRSQFSQPVLIHMDVKPANIIYNMKTNTVSLIDFEFARFGDIDYGWIQILLSERNQFNQFYKEQIIMRMTNGRMTLDDAFKIPKLQCYLFYQAMCNLIYYYDRNLSCPKEIKEIFDYFISRF